MKKRQNQLDLIDGTWWIHRSLLCMLLGMSTKTIGDWIRDRGFPRPRNHNRGPFDLSAVLKWFAEERKKIPTTKSAEQKTRDLKDRILVVKAGEAEGRLVDKDQAVRSVERGITEAKGLLEGLAHTIGALVPEEVRGDVMEQARKVVETVLKSLAEGKRIGK